MTNFFITAAGASAALAGLVFVALSVNIQNILRAPQLPTRAGATIAMLILILVCSMVTLVPQPPRPLGLEITAFALFGFYLQIVSARRSFLAQAVARRPLWEGLLNAATGQVQVLPFLAGGILVFLDSPRGLYWVAAGCISVFVFSVLNSWVLLVEILR